MLLLYLAKWNACYIITQHHQNRQLTTGTVVCTFRVINNSKNVSRETMLKSVGRSKCLPLGWMHAEKWQYHWQIICCNYSLIQLAHCTHFYIPQQSGGYMFILFVCVSFCEQITEKVTSRYNWNLELWRGLPKPTDTYTSLEADTAT